MYTAMDVGGTFLDAVVMDETGRVTTAKVLSDPMTITAAACVRPSPPSRRKLGLLDQGFLTRCRLIINGTTVATNVMAELRGPKVGLLTTQGFRRHSLYGSGASLGGNQPCPS